MRSKRDCKKSNETVGIETIQKIRRRREKIITSRDILQDLKYMDKRTGRRRDQIQVLIKKESVDHSFEHRLRLPLRDGNDVTEFLFIPLQ